MSGSLINKTIDDLFLERYTYKLNDEGKNIIRDTEEYEIFSKSYNLSKISLFYGNKFRRIRY